MLFSAEPSSCPPNKPAIAFSASAFCLADQHAFARCQPIRFHHHRQMEHLQRRQRLSLRFAHRVVRRRNRMPLHEPLRMRLARLEQRRFPRRPKYPVPALLQRIHQPQRQRQFRTHYRQIRFLLRHHPQQIVDVLLVRPNALRHRGDPAIPRRADHLTHPRRTTHRRRQRMLAPTSTNHQHLHALIFPRQPRLPARATRRHPRSEPCSRCPVLGARCPVLTAPPARPAKSRPPS